MSSNKDIDPVVRMKRRIRDHFNKTTNDVATLNQVAEIIGMALTIINKEEKE